MVYIILAFLIGITIVINMMLNSRLAERVGMICGIMLNYSMALVSSAVLCAVMLRALPAYADIRAIPLPYFIGGSLGVLTTYLFNLIVAKVPAVYVVMLRFTGQMLTSAVIDYIYMDVFSKGKVIGGVLFFLGLAINAKLDADYAKKEKSYKEACYEIRDYNI